ncbi:MAG TPA: membrane protein insertion efficiency factor YidD [Clostridiales bacterium]|nr:membrane protein insertion efficiency factor YidD [Clostridiales bacterium]
MKQVFLFLISLYQKYISPITPRSCRFIPSCSQYSYQAIKKYGAFKGLILGIIRISKCHPFHKGGYDPLK